jgi:hypothetical protein
VYIRDRDLVLSCPSPPSPELPEWISREAEGDERCGRVYEGEGWGRDVARIDYVCHIGASTVQNGGYKRNT